MVGQVGPSGSSGSSEGGGITNDAPVGAIPVTADGDGNLAESSIVDDLDANPTIGFNTDENGIVTLAAVGIGAQLFIEAADGDDTHPGGELSILSGGSAGGTGGQILIVAGDDLGGGDGGEIVIHSGNAVDAGNGGSGGDITIRAGRGSRSDNDGGNINISGGDALEGDGGSVLFQAGNSTNGSQGTIQAYSAGSTQGFEINDSGVNITAAFKLPPIAFTSLPASPAEGMMASITDSNTATWGATIAGGGANHVLAWYSGATWTVIGKAA